MVSPYSFPSMNGPFQQFLSQSAESLVRRTRVRFRAVPQISFNLQKMAFSGKEITEFPAGG
jgi:hypothetical protein